MVTILFRKVTDASIEFINKLETTWLPEKPINVNQIQML